MCRLLEHPLKISAFQSQQRLFSLASRIKSLFINFINSIYTRINTSSTFFERSASTKIAITKMLLIRHVSHP